MYITSDGDEADTKDGLELRRLALAYKVPVITTVAGCRSTNKGLRVITEGKMEQLALQDFFTN